MTIIAKSAGSGKLGDVKGSGDANGGKAFDKESVTGGVSADTLEFLKVRKPKGWVTNIFFETSVLMLSHCTVLFPFRNTTKNSGKQFSVNC